ncbi:hypothetical protein WIS52_14925 [Pseudonocardia nematodicida]|uniref:Uncharacterized protein n=1 Tax=Pseudonocardia nematodicida TaxID=1206997 RepID=A0ABV1KBC1_9PSEU
MSREEAWLVRLPGAGLEQLLLDIEAAAARVPLALPGDRTDVIRFEKLATELERRALVALTSGAEAVQEPDLPQAPTARVFYRGANDEPPSSALAAARPWFRSGDIAVEIRRPFGPGATAASPQANLRQPAKVWRAIGPRGVELTGSRAVEKRFHRQIETALDGDDPEAVIRPSGINNRVLTDGLRKYVERTGQPQRRLPVVYRDGSRGPDFPLRCLPLRGGTPPIEWLQYRFAMLSIRHTEMDAVVQGAWLRNADISQPRPIGETDILAYEQSLEQFARLTRDRPAVVYMYQTGLEAAVLGVYRAATQRMLDQPGRLAVVPMFYVAPRPTTAQETTHIETANFTPGEVWWA